MKLSRSFVLLVLFAVLTACNAPAAKTPDIQAAQVPVLLYHHLAPPGEEPATPAVVPADEFEAHMGWLKTHGYTAITTAALDAWLTRGEGLPPNPVLITFDDGYSSTLTLAAPILERYEMRAAVFMISGSAGQKISGMAHLGWGDLRSMAASGMFEVQAHTHDGHRLIGRQPALLVWSPAQIQADAQALGHAFKAARLPAPTAFAYPFGARNEETVAAIKAAGYKLAFTVEAGLVARGDDPWNLKRQVIFPGTGICRLHSLVTGVVQPCESQGG
ncbi:MAG TPA: polysaccharide deacetylase family protein [Symbiobacteriaceae bacterium]|nr:polysaccharide deacetylase family protein [Symbiobacteriaceae bacterium]